MSALFYCPVQLQEYGGNVELHPKLKLGYLMIVNDGSALAYGHFLGIVQVIRGQHFLFHQFYIMAVCWLTGLFLFSLLRGWQNRQNNRA